MKKYFRPELTISSFDVEDIMVTSGVYGTTEGAAEAGIVKWVNADGADSTIATGAMFSWN